MADKKRVRLAAGFVQETARVLDVFRLPGLKQRQERTVQKYMRLSNTIRTNNQLPAKKLLRVNSKGQIEQL